MSEHFADIEARIDAVHKLEAVITAMRGIAASRVQESQHHLDSIRTFAATIGAAIGSIQAVTFCVVGVGLMRVLRGKVATLGD